MGIAIAQIIRNIILVLLRRDCRNKHTADFMVANSRPRQGLSIYGILYRLASMR